MAGAEGGYTSICAMPNLNPVPDCMENLKLELDAIKKDAVINVYPYGSITKGEKGEELADFNEMKDYVCAFSDDGHGVQNEEMMLKAMEEAKKLNKMIVAHCEDNSLLNGGYIHDGGVYIGKEKIADYDNDLTERYTANIRKLQDEVEVKHSEYLEIKNLYDEKTAGMEPEKAAKAHKKLFVELQAKETEYENMVTKIADLEQSIKTKTFKVFVGIRPEGFIYDPKGVLSLMTDHVEVMGRDKTIVSVHEESVKPTIRTIVEADLKLPEGATTLKFNLKPNKFFLFDGETEERLR